jgi:ABC-2 type transport system permease protein
MKWITLYFWIAYTAARANLAYALETSSRVVFLTVILYVFMRLRTVVYAGASADRLAGFTLPQMLWYLVVTESVALSAPRISSEVDQDVRTGRLAVQLIYPLSYAGAHLSRAMGQRIVRFAMNMGTGSAIALILVGPIPFSAKGFAMFLVILPAAFLLDFFGNFLVGLCAFWLESTAGLALLYLRMVQLLGGMLLPIDMYPEAVRPLLRVLPFAAMIHAPGRMFVAPTVRLFEESLLIQGAALISAVGVVAIVQSIALRRLFANGG